MKCCNVLNFTEKLLYSVVSILSSNPRPRVKLNIQLSVSGTVHRRSTTHQQLSIHIVIHVISKADTCRKHQHTRIDIVHIKATSHALMHYTQTHSLYIFKSINMFFLNYFTITNYFIYFCQCSIIQNNDYN